MSGVSGQPPARTLTDEHQLLLREVTARTDRLLAVAAEDRWPDQELGALLDYLRAEVMRQVADEERLLFPGHDAAPGVARLSRDHARLRLGVEALEQAAAGDGIRSVAELAAVTRDIVDQLTRHLLAEETVMNAAGPDGAPATADLSHRRHEWYPFTEGDVVDMASLPASSAVEAVVDRLLRLSWDEQVELRSGSDPLPVWRRMDRLDPGGFSFSYLQDGPELWRVQVSRRPTR